MKKVLLVFGSKGEAGEGITKVLSSKDYDSIYLYDRKESDFIEKNVHHIGVNDLLIEENVKYAFNKIGNDKESCYFLVSTIGGFAGGNEIKDSNYQEWQSIMEKNLNVSFLISKYFAGLASSTSGGSICFLSAVTAFEPTANKAAYGTSKSALNYLVQTLAKEGNNGNFTSNALAPGVIDTPANRKWVKDPSKMVNAEAIGELVHAVFENYKILSGNILRVPGTLNYS